MTNASVIAHDERRTTSGDTNRPRISSGNWIARDGHFSEINRGREQLSIDCAIRTEIAFHDHRGPASFRAFGIRRNVRARCDETYLLLTKHADAILLR